MKTNRKNIYTVLLPVIAGLVIFSLFGCSDRTTASDTQATDSSNFTITVNYKQAQPGDTLSLYLLNPIHNYPTINDKGQRVITATEKQGCFTFKIPVERDYGYFKIMKPRTFSDKGNYDSRMSIIEKQFWERGDSVLIAISHKETAGGIYGTWKFYGKGSEKYRIRDSVFSIEYNDKEFPRYTFDENFDYIVNGLIKKRQLTYLENEKHDISEAAYESLKADVLYSSLNFRTIQKYFNDSIKTASESVRKAFVAKYKKYSNESRKVKGEGISQEVLANNPTYLGYLKYKLITDSEILHGNYDQDWIYKRIKSATTGLLRERLVVMTFLNTKRSKNVKEIVADAKSYFQDPYCIRFLQNVENRGEGTPVLDATFHDVEGRPVRISDFKGKVVLLDFWFNGCSGCIQVYNKVTSKLHSHFRDNSDFVILSINVDRSKQRWLDGIDRGGYTDADAKNVYTNGKGTKHPFMVENQIRIFPWLILIDREGIIRYMENEEFYEWETLRKTVETILSE